MNGRRIRLRYVGLVNFISNLISVFTGMMFITMVSRRLSESEFGLWSFLGVLLQYFIIPSSITNYWLTRYTGRGFKVGRTGFFLNSLLMLIAVLLFPIISPNIVLSSGFKDNLPLIISILTIQIPAEYFSNTFTALAQGAAPQYIGYGQLILEPTKLIAGYFLVVVKNYGLPGALLSYIIARYMYALFLALSLRGEFSEKFRRDLSVKWVKLGWLPAYSLIPSFLNNLDVMLVTLLLQSTVPVGHFKAINTVIAVVLYSRFLASALYPKLLSGGGAKDVNDAVGFMLMFAFPMAFGATAMSKSFLSLLRSSYTVSSDALAIAALQAVTLCLSNIYSSCLVATERVELKDNITFYDYLKSRLFYVPSIRILFRLVYLIGIFLMLHFMGLSSENPSLIVFLWFSLKFFLNFSFLLKFYFDAKSLLNLSFPWRQIVKYAFSSSIMFIILYLWGGGLKSYVKFYDALLVSLKGVLLGSIIYFALTYIVDVEFRKFIKSILSRFI